MTTTTAAGTLRRRSPQGRLAITATVLGAGVAFLDASVVNAALPAIAADFDADVAGMQWVVTGYLLTLGSLLVLGGSLGDLFGRRRLYVGGLAGFAAASVLCGLAPSLPILVAARIVQGVAGAALTPGSLALLTASFHPDDRAAAIGAWSGLGGTATAIGPFLGGWLIDAASWRWVFLLNVPLAAAAIVLVRRAVPESFDETAARHVDVPGAATLSLGLAGIVYGLIEGPDRGWWPLPVAALAAGAALVVAFVAVERRSPAPMVPLRLFAIRAFAAANGVTVTVYAALGAVTFFLVVHLQQDLGYSALEAGAALLPVTVLMLLLAARGGALAQRIGPRVPMTAGPLLIAAATALLVRVEPGSGYLDTVLPAALVLGAGLVLTVAPLTATVLGAVEDAHAGVASAVNNAVARLASLLAVALLPAVTGAAASTIGHGYRSAMAVCAGLAIAGGAVSLVALRSVPGTGSAAGTASAS